ncbi:hypothetical protein OROMI_030028 [Orobanche minor]
MNLISFPLRLRIMLLAMFIMDKLREFNELFNMPNSSEISLHSALKTPEDRTIAVEL